MDHTFNYPIFNNIFLEKKKREQMIKLAVKQTKKDVNVSSYCNVMKELAM